jgi:hypothetical protein
VISLELEGNTDIVQDKIRQELEKTIDDLTLMDDDLMSKVFDDGSHIIYVNGKYDADDDIGRLMKDCHQICTFSPKQYMVQTAEIGLYRGMRVSVSEITTSRHSSSLQGS